ncbi:unnamed protein product [Rhizoctonia solani]|uniref:Uncharacterized protein n=1 Tax=Rhizoctonia solani TaxID=456999 RepID=A0A8H2ZZM9_9AGAM|nr:unnamed protein product [Rhizoctonia solani]
MFTGHLDTFTKSASRKWSTDALIRLRALSRNTALERPVMSFIQYFISTNLEGMTGSTYSGDSCNAYVCVNLYNAVKRQFVDPVLLGCIFFKLSSLGHRSWIWSQFMTRRDKAILYAAQAQFVDAAAELQSLEWLAVDPICREITEDYWCDTCQPKVTAAWKRYFRELGQGLGSNLPLKDVSILSQVASNRWRFYEECTAGLAQCCGFRGWCFLPLPDGMLSMIDKNIRELYEEVAFVYRELAGYDKYAIACSESTDLL